MRNNKRRLLALLGLLVVLVFALGTTGLAAGDPTEEPGSKMVVCADCGGEGICMTCYGQDPACEDCGGTGVCASCEGTGYVESPSPFYNTAWALLPPVIAIALALITKEVYSSLFIGILVGGLLYSNFSFEGTLTHVFEDGIVAALADSYNVGILIFLVILGAMVCLMNRAGGSAAFGRWAQNRIKSRVGAQLITVLLGILIFIDDYFNCLTVGSVMRPVTDKYKVSRAKLAYIIDSTAAPVCIIAPISSWAAAVAGFAEDGQGLNLFIKAIPYNLYSLLTFVFIIALSFMQFDYGPMRAYERKAQETGDLSALENAEDEAVNPKGKVIDLLLPVLVLIAVCTTGMIYVGGFFGVDAWGGTDCAGDFIGAFGNTDAFMGLPWGGIIALLGVIVLPITSGDTAFRSARLTLADWLKIDQDSYANRLKLCIPVLGVGAFLGIGNALGFINYTVIWRYFSWTNQTLAMIVLWAASMYLFKEKKNYWITAVPATFMSAVSCTYFVLAPECLGKMINTYADGKLVAYNTAVAYPIGIIFAIAMLALFIHATKKHTASQKA